MRSIVFGFCAAILALIVWRHAIPGGFLLYQGIATGAAAAVAVWLFKRQDQSAAKDALLVFLLVYGFVFTVPTTVDRSYSVRMIELVAGARDGVKKEEISSMFQGYFSEGGGVERRLTEQTATGTMRAEGNRYVASSLGRFFATAFHVTAELFRCGSAA